MLANIGDYSRVDSSSISTNSQEGSMHSHGQGMIEYALIFVQVAVVVIAILVLLGPAIVHQVLVPVFPGL